MSELNTLNSTKIVLESPNVVCTKCGSKLFEEVYALKKISKLYTGSGKDSIQPIPLFRCADCHEIVSDYLDNKNAKYIFGETESSDNKKEETKSNLII